MIINALKLAHEIGLNNDIIHAVYIYIISTTKESEAKKLITEINQTLPYYRENFMTYAEALEKKGIQKGRLEERRNFMTMAEALEKKGMQKGRQEGRQELQLEIAKRLIDAGYSFDEVTRITELSPNELTNRC